MSIPPVEDTCFKIRSH